MKSKWPIIKTVLCILLIFSFYNLSFAATFYFSTSAGNDQHTFTEAQNPKTPWRSIEKLNVIFYSLNAGDSVLLKRGDVFNGSIVITRSGAPFAPIYIGAYAKGSKPVINGLVELKNWTATGNGIYETSSVSNGNMLIINGEQKAIGRYPNKGYLTYQSHDSNNSITDKNLPSEIDWTGAEAVIRKNRWVIDKSVITAQSAEGKLTYAAGTRDIPTNAYGYFIQNSIKTLDEFGEWFYDGKRKSMMVFFGNNKPEKYAVTSSGVNTLVDIKKHNYIAFDNLAFVGAGVNAFDVKNSSNISVNNCSIDITGCDAIAAAYSPFFTLKNTLINHSLNAAVNFDMGCIYASVINNEIKNTGLMTGMGKSGTGTYEAVTAFGDNSNIEKNHIDSTGYDGIYIGGNSSVARNNFIDYFCLVKDDGGGIYIADWTKTINKKVIGNIVLHGIGIGEGTSAPHSLQAEGIYVDDNTESLTITGNTISLCANNGIKLHNAKDINVNNNTVFNNGVQLRMEQDHYIPTSALIRNNSVTNNIFFSKNSSQPNAKYSTQSDDISSFGRIDSNFYSRPDDLAEFKINVVRDGKDVYKTYDLSDWKGIYNKDNVSTKTIRKLTINNDAEKCILFEYNASNLVKIITLTKPYLDSHNQLHRDKITLAPYSSVILIAANVSKRPNLLTQLATR